MDLRAALAGALRLPPHAAVAFVGAGGKTTALFELARALAPAIATTTTHLAGAQAALADTHVTWVAGTPCAALGLEGRDGVTLVSGELDQQTGRVHGLEATQWCALRDWCALHGRALLVEADGSRQRPLKAPAAHEPAIPQPVDAVVVVAGMLGCGLPLDDEHVHRPVRFAALSGCSLGDPVSPEAMAAVLAHPDGGLKHIPRGAKRIVLLNQADTFDLRRLAASVARRLRPVYDAVIVASLRDGWVERL